MAPLLDPLVLDVEEVDPRPPELLMEEPPVEDEDAADDEELGEEAPPLPVVFELVSI